MKKAVYGYNPGLSERILRIISKLLIKILRLNGSERFSNIFIQLLNPICSTIWKPTKQKIFFRTGHGRLLWRVKTFYDEEPLMIDWLTSFNTQDIFLDIGANVGMYTIPAAIQCKIVYACELDPINIGTLKENVHLNRLHQKVLIIPFGGARTTEVVDVHYRDFSKGDALQSIGRESIFNTITGEGKHMMRQLVFPLDSTIQMFNLEPPNKIKIDVDGNERTLFDGAKNIILRADEIYFENSNTEGCSYVKEQIKAAGFRIVKSEDFKVAGEGSNLLFRCG